MIHLNKFDSISAPASEQVRSKAIEVGVRSRDCKFDSHFLQERKKLEFHLNPIWTAGGGRGKMAPLRVLLNISKTV